MGRFAYLSFMGRNRGLIKNRKKEVKMIKDDIIRDYIRHLRDMTILSDEDLAKIMNKWVETDQENLEVIKKILYDKEKIKLTVLAFAESSKFKDNESDFKDFKDTGTEINICVENGCLSTEELKKLRQCIREIEQNNTERLIKIWMETPEKAVEEISFMEDTKTTKTIDRLIKDINFRLAEYIDSQLYLPLKEELKGTAHSLGIKKELLKQKIESELEILKKGIEGAEKK